MKSVSYTFKAAFAAALALGAMIAVQNAHAGGTPSGTSVGNLATVDYDVGSVAQLPIESAPTPAGNSTPGVGNGTATTFVVDNKVDLTVAELGGLVTLVGPGETDAVTVFTVTNTGNTPQDYALTVANLTASDPAVHSNLDTGLDVSNFRIRVDGNANGTYESGSDTAAFIDSLAPDATITVFVLADVPLSALDNGVANVRLTAATHVAGSGASNLVVETTTADTSGVDVVFADNGRDGKEAADDGYQVESANLTISKASTLISDPFNNAVNPKAIPGALLEYAVTVTNNGSQPATNIDVSDTLTSELTLALGAYGAGNDVTVEVGAGPATTSYCTADANDGDGDGCGVFTGELHVKPAGLTVGTTAADNPVRVLFRATIN